MNSIYKNELVDGMTLKSMQAEFNGVYEIVGFVPGDIEDLVEIRELVIGNRFMVPKSIMESSLWYEVVQDKFQLKSLKDFTVDRKNLQAEIKNLKAANAALSKLAIEGGSDVQDRIRQRLERYEDMEHANKFQWKLMIEKSYVKKH